MYFNSLICSLMTSSSQTLNITCRDVKGQQRRKVGKMKEKNGRSTAEEQRCLTSNFIKRNHLQLFIDPFSVLIGRRLIPFKVLIGQFRRRTPWQVLCDRLLWKVWCLPGRSYLRPSSSYGRRGGGGGKRHRGIQPLHMLSPLEKA